MTRAAATTERETQEGAAGNERRGARQTKETRYTLKLPEISLALPPLPAEVLRLRHEALRKEDRRKKVAIFIAHGMGQQIPFQTLDQVAEGLRRYGRTSGDPDVRATRFKDEWLSRIEMELESDTGETIDTHIYEGYWAPLTEGKITARGVIDFLRGAAGNGIRNGSRAFYRWLFGNYREYDSPIRIVLYLLIALVTVLSLVLMNSTIAAVAAGRALLATPPPWLSDGLFADLTTTFNAVVTVSAAFGISLGIAYVLRRRKAPPGARKAWGLLTIALFIAALFAMTLAALAIVLIFYGHLELRTIGGEQLWHSVLSPGTIDGFNDCFDKLALWLALLGGAAFLVSWIVRIIMGVTRDMASGRRWLTLFVAICGVLLGGLGIWLVIAFQHVFEGLAGSRAAEIAASGLAWPLIIATSAFIRKLLVQYVGDVAIYVAPYRVDGFFQLRSQIKDCVHRTAQAIYAQQRADGSGPEYDQVFVVGHSLGSVVVYDVLNRLINDDEADGRTLDVARRTPLLLTFGSPLDKIAFLFAVQRQHTDEAREALAATVQPLIQNYAFRPERWINIYSPWDVVSGHLGFYDPPGSTDPRRVCNIDDPDATTLLAAHVEYWNNPLLFTTLCDAVCGNPMTLDCRD